MVDQTTVVEGNKMHHHAHAMNDLSSKTMHSHANGYGPNMQKTITIKPIIKSKTIGFADQTQVMKYATTKSLPSHDSHPALQSQRPGTVMMTSSVRGHQVYHSQRERPHSHHGHIVHLSHSGHHRHNGHHNHIGHHGGHHSNIGHHGSHHSHGSHTRSSQSGMVFKRQPLEKKERNITSFEIELEKPDKYIYKPGDELKGSVRMDVAKNVEIRFLELIVVGQGSTSLNMNRKGTARIQKELFLCKRTYVIGTPDSRWSSMLTPGQYVSNFKVKLPKDLPSTTSFNELSTGVSFDINYFLKVRICDDIGSASMRSIVTNNNAVKVLISRKHEFIIQRSFDIHLIPNAMVPVEHEEELVLSCGNNSVAKFTLGLERAVYLAGDDIKLQLSCQLPSTQRIKDLTCIFRQHISLREIGDRQSFILSEITKHNPNDDQVKEGPFTIVSIEAMIPTQTHLISSFLVSCATIRVGYTLEVVLRLQPAGGTVSFTMPLAIGPCAEPVNTQKAVTKKCVPVFNRPVRFPCFSPSQQNGGNLAKANSKSSQSINVVTVYNNSAVSRCFLCCLGGAAD